MPNNLNSNQEETNNSSNSNEPVEHVDLKSKHYPLAGSDERQPDEYYQSDPNLPGLNPELLGLVPHRNNLFAKIFIIIVFLVVLYFMIAVTGVFVHTGTKEGNGSNKNTTQLGTTNNRNWRANLNWRKYMTPRIRAPELSQIQHWLNVKQPLTLQELKGKVVVLDFWTLCCINCIQTIPELTKLEEKYQDQPVVFIGIHSPKFPYERELEAVKYNALKYDVRHPIGLDSNNLVWEQYQIRAWPTLVLIDPEGYLTAYFTGEGNEETLDTMIGLLLQEYSAKNQLNLAPVPTLQPPSLPTNQLAFPGKIIADQASNRLFISDSGHHRIVVANTTGQVLEIIGSGTAGYQDGDKSTAKFNFPQGLAFDSTNQILYIADTRNHLLRSCHLPSGEVKTLAGTGRKGYVRQPAANPLQTELASPWDLTLSADNQQLYIAMAGRHQIWVYHIPTHKIDILAGTGREDRQDGGFQFACFAQPSGIVYHNEKLYVADSEVSAIRVLDLKSKIVNSIVGGELFIFGDKDDIGLKAKLQHPLGLSVTDNEVIITDTFNHKIKRISLDSEKVTTIAGRNASGLKDGPALLAEFNEPSGICYINNRFYIADSNNHRIRILDIDNQTVNSLQLNLD